MAVVNVNRNNPDQFYRYKMPKLIAKVEGKGNGIKTVISNMIDVAKALSRPPTYPTKFFGCELGAQTQFDFKRDRYIVNGAHEGEKLQDLLDNFIKKFVLCPECENPETKLTVHSKSSTISQRCIACGYNGKLDMRHKLTTFILKNPPDGPLEGGATASVKQTKKKGDSTGGEDGDNSPDETNGDQAKSAQEIAADIRAGDSTGEGLARPLGAYDDEEVEWGEDTSEEGQQRRVLELSQAAATLALSKDLEKTPHERADLFYVYIQTKMKECAGNGSTASVYKSILAEAERLELKDKGVIILAELLLSTPDIAKELKKYQNLFVLFTQNNPRAQRYLLGAFEKIVGVELHDQLIGKVPFLLKELFELDLVEEQAFFEWDKKVSTKYVAKKVGQEIHAKAAPFIKWLREAEEESSDEDSEEEEDDLDVDFTNAEKVGIKEKPSEKTNGVNGAAKVQEQEADEDEIDIDDI